MSSILKIRPLLKILPDGTLSVIQKFRGARSHAVKGLLRYIINQLNSNQIKQMFITHLNCEDEVDFLINEIKAMDNPVDVRTAQVGCVLAMHSGTKPLGIAYCVD